MPLLDEEAFDAAIQSRIRREMTTLVRVASADDAEGMVLGESPIPSAFTLIEGSSSDGRLIVGSKQQKLDIEANIVVVASHWLSKVRGIHGVYKILKLLKRALANYTPGWLDTGEDLDSDLRFLAHFRPAVGDTRDAKMISIAIVVAGFSTPLSVSVTGMAITINLATDGAGLATSTAAQVVAAVIASATAYALVTPQLLEDGAGAGVMGALAQTYLATTLSPLVFMRSEFFARAQDRTAYDSRWRTTYWETFD